MTTGSAVCLLGVLLVGDSTNKMLSLAGLSAPVEVYFDSFDIPHIYAQSWPDAARALGYVHAGERLVQMEIFRRRASGNLAEIMGPDVLSSDILMRQLGLRRSVEAYWKSNQVPPALREELEAYAAGVNARVAELKKSGLPPVFQALGVDPAPWTPPDSLVFTKYMGWDQSGTTDDLWFGMMVEKLGVDAVQELWPLSRPYEVPIVVRQTERASLAKESLSPVPGSAAAFVAAHKAVRFERWLGEGTSFGSNNWAVDGTKTASGKPMLCNDPHLGFSLPMLWYTCHLCVAGKSICGVGFPGGPGIVIGHTDHHAWGVTNMQADAVDFFVETMNPDDPMQYKHRGEWKRVQRVSEAIPVRGAKPHPLDVDLTVHGPIISREGKVISMQWTGFGPTTDSAALWGMSRAESMTDFLKAVDELAVPCMNVIYTDIDGNIAIHPAGKLPVRALGQGRIPMDGASGAFDWETAIPRSKLPLSVNPKEHFVASANNRPVPDGFPYYVGWMWDPSYRARRINEMLASAQKLTTDSMAKILHDDYDKAAERFLPPLLAALDKVTLTDSREKQARDVLANWNFVAAIDSPAPLVWLRWFSTYRGAVWDDEWETRGIEKMGGSWGFCGDNLREPMLEILESMTRDQPNSRWFDDRRTPVVEDRDAILVRSFQMAVASITKDFGDSVEGWRWRNFHKLKIGSLLGDPRLERIGGPVPGTPFTVNPGDNIGTLGGGASWRMIVDFGNLHRSVGVYPGGQSEDPQSPHYDDQMKLWKKLQFVDLNMVGKEKLPASAVRRRWTLSP